MTRDGEPIHDLEDFMAEAANFADGSGYVDYMAFSECMLQS